MITSRGDSTTITVENMTIQEEIMTTEKAIATMRENLGNNTTKKAKKILKENQKQTTMIQKTKTSMITSINNKKEKPPELDKLKIGNKITKTEIIKIETEKQKITKVSEIMDKKNKMTDHTMNVHMKNPNSETTEAIKIAITTTTKTLKKAAKKNITPRTT